MSRRETNIPNPYILMNSMRSMGYSFESAVADIIDNSICAEAKNIWISMPVSFDDGRIFITILDDGYGMDYESLLNAMKYGSEKEGGYGSKDLGRFGLGLKSASMSQCRVLTVASKKNGIFSCIRWDLNYVEKNQDWLCLVLDDREIREVPNIDKLEELDEGTLVVWEQFDFAEKKSDGRLYKHLSSELDEASKRISLVFHRFLNSKKSPLNIYVNNLPIKGLDPFLENSSNSKVDYRKTSYIPCTLENGTVVKVAMQACVLPHQNDLTSEEIESLGGLEEVKNGQGFYVYRNNRLIINGTWFRTAAKSLDPEIYKYGRIKVDIPNSLDEMWGIDIKKQNAVIPKSVLKHFMSTVNEIREGSKRKTEKRAKLSDDNPNTIWSKSQSREGKDSFFINLNSHYMMQFLDEFEDKDRAKIIRMLDVVSSKLPFDDIYSSVCSKKQDTELDDDELDSTVLACWNMAKGYSMLRGCSMEEAIEVYAASGTEPFDNEKAVELLKKRIKNGQ